MGVVFVLLSVSWPYPKARNSVATAPLWQLLELQAQILEATTASRLSALTIKIIQRGRREVSDTDTSVESNFLPPNCLQS